MSRFDHDKTTCTDSQKRTVITPRERDLGGFSVHRCLPSSSVPMIGPFIFFDHIGPATFPAGRGIDVRPHPHINLATVTYLFEGTILHRDSLGSVQPITPGAINWMTAGHGIVHSERTPAETRQQSHQAHGLQLWVALPEAEEEITPDFCHYSADVIPEMFIEDVRLRLLVGCSWGLESPVKTLSPTLFCEASVPAGSSLTLPEQIIERGVYLLSGAINENGYPLDPQTMTCFTPETSVTLTATEDAHCVIIGGAPLSKRHIWWNFVSSRPERIEQAKQAWRDGSFPAVPDDPEFTPLPE